MRRGRRLSTLQTRSRSPVLARQTLTRPPRLMLTLTWTWWIWIWTWPWTWPWAAVWRTSALNLNLSSLKRTRRTIRIEALTLAQALTLVEKQQRQWWTRTALATALATALTTTTALGTVLAVALTSALTASIAAAMSTTLALAPAAPTLPAHEPARASARITIMKGAEVTVRVQIFILFASWPPVAPSGLDDLGLVLHPLSSLACLRITFLVQPDLPRPPSSHTITQEFFWFQPLGTVRGQIFQKIYTLAILGSYLHDIT